MARKKTRKRYTEESRREAVNLVLIGGFTSAKAARKLRINPNTLRDWVRQAQKWQNSNKVLDSSVDTDMLDDSIDIREVDNDRGYDSHRDSLRAEVLRGLPRGRRYFIKEQIIKKQTSPLREVSPRLIASVKSRPQDDHIFAISVPKNIYEVLVRFRHNERECEAPRLRRICHNPYTNEVVLTNEHFPTEFKNGHSALNVYVLDRPQSLDSNDDKVLVESVLESLTKKLPGMISRALSEALS